MLAASLTACGSDGEEREALTREEYRQALGTAVGDFGAKIDDVEDFDVTGAETKAEGRLLLEALRRQTDRLAAVEPPGDAAQAHDRLLEGLEALGDHVESELAELETDEAASGDEVEDRLLRGAHVEPAIAKIEAAARELEEAGYEPVVPGG